MNRYSVFIVLSVLAVVYGASSEESLRETLNAEEDGPELKRFTRDQEALMDLQEPKFEESSPQPKTFSLLPPSAFSGIGDLGTRTHPFESSAHSLLTPYSSQPSSQSTYGNYEESLPQQRTISLLPPSALSGIGDSGTRTHPVETAVESSAYSQPTPYSSQHSSQSSYGSYGYSPSYGYAAPSMFYSAYQPVYPAPLQQESYISEGQQQAHSHYTTVPYISGYRMTPIYSQKRVVINENSHQVKPNPSGKSLQPKSRSSTVYRYVDATNEQQAFDVNDLYEDPSQSRAAEPDQLKTLEDYEAAIQDLKYQLEHLESLKANLVGNS